MCVCHCLFIGFKDIKGFYILETFEKTILCASLVMLYLPCFWCEICVLYSQGSFFILICHCASEVALRNRTTIHRILPQKSPCAEVGFFEGYEYSNSMYVAPLASFRQIHIFFKTQVHLRELAIFPMYRKRCVHLIQFKGNPNTSKDM